MCEKTTEATREEQIQRAFDDLRTARIELHEVSEADLKAREILKTAESAIRLQYADRTKELGGNEPARDARIREMTATELLAAEQMRDLKGHAQLMMDLASMRVQELQWLVRNDQAAADLYHGYVPK